MRFSLRKPWLAEPLLMPRLETISSNVTGRAEVKTYPKISPTDPGTPSDFTSCTQKRMISHRASGSWFAAAALSGSAGAGGMASTKLAVSFIGWRRSSNCSAPSEQPGQKNARGGAIGSPRSFPHENQLGSTCAWLDERCFWVGQKQWFSMRQDYRPPGIQLWPSDRLAPQPLPRAFVGV